jgi:FkbM family methyltransferase
MKLSSLFRQEDRTLIETYCRDRARSSYLGDHTAICRVLGELLMYVDTRDLSLTPHMLMNGYWEMWVSQAIASYVKPGMRCIDVGANCGYFTLLLSELVGDKGFVEAFEPQPGLAALLKKSITVNGFGRQTSVVASAVGDQNRPAMLTEHQTLMGSASLHGIADPDVSMRQVEMVTLDKIGYGEPVAPAIDFIKIDVEGYELKVLEGMQQLIQASPKLAIAMEFTPIDHQDPEKALLRIQEMGLLLGTIGTDGLVRPITIQEAAVPDNGGYRMLWLTRVPS